MSKKNVHPIWDITYQRANGATQFVVNPRTQTCSVASSALCSLLAVDEDDDDNEYDEEEEDDDDEYDDDEEENDDDEDEDAPIICLD